MNWVQNLVIKLLKIIPAVDREIHIREAYTFQQNVQKNRVLYQGEPTEIEQFFKATANTDTAKTRFWAACPNGKIRKIHSGIVGMVVDRYKDIITADIDSIDFGEQGELKPISALWEKIADDNAFINLLGESVQKVLALGDGAFKISSDKISAYPILEFYESDNVDFKRRYGRLVEIKFYTDYSQDNKVYRLEEIYGKGYIKYHLYNAKGNLCDLKILEETKHLEDIGFSGDFMMAVPFKIFNSSKYKGRGKALFDGKTDVIDALDEVISQWLDAVRLGRIKRYIPEDLIPRDESTGELLPANPFDNDFMAIGGDMSEGGRQQIDISQPTISYEAYLNSYISFMDMALQGIISPATLGIDLKKTDNAEAQREKEKITMYVRGKIIDALNTIIPDIVSVSLKANDVLYGRIPGNYQVSVKFGEYASPDFDSTVETVSKARQFGVMSIEKAIEELYGDRMSEEEKQEEINRIKAEQGITSIGEPAAVDIEAEKDTSINLLNGAQISSLMNVIRMVKEGSVSRTEAVSIITATLGISKENAESFMEDRIQESD